MLPIYSIEFNSIQLNPGKSDHINCTITLTEWSHLPNDHVDQMITLTNDNINWMITLTE